jgi:hypothetical protein
MLFRQELPNAEVLNKKLSCRERKRERERDAAREFNKFLRKPISLFAQYQLGFT